MDLQACCLHFSNAPVKRIVKSVKIISSHKQNKLNKQNRAAKTKINGTAVYARIADRASPADNCFHIRLNRYACTLKTGRGRKSVTTKTVSQDVRLLSVDIG